MSIFLKAFIIIIAALLSVGYVPKQRHKLYLTIDDGPSESTIEIVDFLNTNKIPAIFYCLGKALEEYPHEAEYIVKNGYQIGNHSYSHKNFLDLDIEEAKKEILLTDKLIDEVYKRTGKKRKFKTFRYPYISDGFHEGYEGKRVKKNYKRFYLAQLYLERLGYQRMSWIPPDGDSDRIDLKRTIDTLDYQVNVLDEKRILAKVSQSMNEIVNYNASVILVHDSGNADLLFKIVNEYKKHSVKFSKLDKR